MSTLAPLVEPRLTLTPEQAARYARHFTLPGVGAEGQSRLAGARVLSIGAGGLGSPVLLYLAAAGVGTLGVIDDDAVDSSNLQRQIIHADTATGTAKTESAAVSIRRLNPGVTVTEHTRTHRTRTLTITRDPARIPITNLTTVTGEITAHSATLSEETVPEISPADFARTHRDYTLLDVRETHERDTAGYYPGSHHHPHQQLLTALASGATLTEATGIPNTVPLVIYCAGGVRSAKVLRQLIKNNHPGTAYSLAGGYTPLTMK